MGDTLDADRLRNPVNVSLGELKDSSVPFHVLEDAFGPKSLGILMVKDLPPEFHDLRLKLLSYASYLANLPAEELEAITCPEAKYLTGWSHGKEALKSGSFDSLKGSYYVNCAFYQGKTSTIEPSPDFPEFTAPNVWPRDTSLPLFREIFEELCILIIDIAILVARACDRYATSHVQGYDPGYLEHVVKSSKLTKARLLHYFPPNPSNADRNIATDSDGSVSSSPEDSWCGTHVDHGCLTGLTSAAYIDEIALPSRSSASKHSAQTTPLSILPTLQSPPDPSAGLYIHARDSSITKVSIPQDCLAFQTGEALQVITGGKFKAVPHFVRACKSRDDSRVARNTLAVFTQPNLNEIVDRERRTTFGEFSKEVVERYG